MKNLRLKSRIVQQVLLAVIFVSCLGSLFAQQCRKQDYSSEFPDANYIMEVIENPKPAGELGFESIILVKRSWSGNIIKPATEQNLGWTIHAGRFKDGSRITTNDVIRLWDIDMKELSLHSFMIADDPNTTQVNEREAYKYPIQEGGIKVTTNGNTTTYDPAASDPGIHPTEKLPEGFLEIDISSGSDIGDPRVIKFIFTGGKDENGDNKGICAYKVDINDNMVSRDWEVTDMTGNGDYDYDWVSTTNEETLSFRLNCEKVQACIGPRLSSITCGGSISSFDNFVINLPQIPDYYEVELIIEGNGMSQGSNIGYVSVPACSTCTTATANVSTSSFYLWDGYWTAYPRVRASGSSEWERGPACWFYYNSSGARLVRGSNGESQQITSRIYPNPSDESGFNVELSGLHETSNNVRVNIYDLLGKEVHTEQLSAGGVNQVIHLNEDGTLQAGFYLVSINVNGKTFNEKIQVK